MAGAFAVIVILDLVPAHAAAFSELVRANATASLDNELDCECFDVVVSDEQQVYLYELYANQAAFTAHLATPHFKSFDYATRHMVRSKQVLTGMVAAREASDGR